MKRDEETLVELIERYERNMEADPLYYSVQYHMNLFRRRDHESRSLNETKANVGGTGSYEDISWLVYLKYESIMCHDEYAFEDGDIGKSRLVCYVENVKSALFFSFLTLVEI